MRSFVPERLVRHRTHINLCLTHHKLVSISHTTCRYPILRSFTITVDKRTHCLYDSGRMDSSSLPQYEHVNHRYNVANARLLEPSTPPVIASGGSYGQSLNEQKHSQDSKERQHWTVIKAKIDKRRKQGKRTVVYRHGRLVTEEVLAEMFQKYCHEEQAPPAEDSKAILKNSPSVVEGAGRAVASGHLNDDGSNNERLNGQPMDNCRPIPDIGKRCTGSSDLKDQHQEMAKDAPLMKGAMGVLPET